MQRAQEVGLEMEGRQDETQTAQRGTRYNDLQGTKSPAAGTLLCPHSRQHGTCSLCPETPPKARMWEVGPRSLPVRKRWEAVP